jgi:signal transduction histidine kinase
VPHRVGLKLVIDCQPLNQYVFVDTEMWEKIVLNLLSNALKFTIKGRIEVRLVPVSGAQQTMLSHHCHATAF